MDIVFRCVYHTPCSTGSLYLQDNTNDLPHFLLLLEIVRSRILIRRGIKPAPNEDHHSLFFCYLKSDGECTEKIYLFQTAAKGPRVTRGLNELKFRKWRADALFLSHQNLSSTNSASKTAPLPSTVQSTYPNQRRTCSFRVIRCTSCLN